MLGHKTPLKVDGNLRENLIRFSVHIFLNLVFKVTIIIFTYIGYHKEDKHAQMEEKLQTSNFKRFISYNVRKTQEFTNMTCNKLLSDLRLLDSFYLTRNEEIYTNFSNFEQNISCRN